MAYLCKVEICGVDTSKLPVLNSEQTIALFQQYQNGAQDAREQLIYSNLRLVLSVIQRFANRNENADDLAYMSQKEAEIKSGGVRTTAKAVKEGLTGVESVFCKHCGASIDSDSKFCKKCGKEQ